MISFYSYERRFCRISSSIAHNEQNYLDKFHFLFARVSLNFRAFLRDFIQDQ